jgi:hypothetical protein
VNDEKEGRPYYSIDDEGTEEETREPEESFESMGEKPMLVLKPSWSFRQMRVISLLLILASTCFYFAWVILPFLETGNIASVNLHATMAEKTKLVHWGVLFFIAFPIVLPCVLLPLLFNSGTFCFYHDRLEMIPIFSRGKNVIIPYRLMHVRLRKGGVCTAMAVMKQSTPSWAHPLRRYKVLYWDMLPISGIGLPLRPQKFAGIETGIKSPWENPEDLPKAVQILRERAFEFKEG